MTTLREAAEQALNFLDNCDLADSFNPPTSQWGLELREALRTALAEQPEPVAVGVLIRGEGGAFRFSMGDHLLNIYAAPPGEHPLYLHPPREPVRLTDEQITDIFESKTRWHYPPIGATDREFARDIEAAVLAANGRPR